MRSSGARPTLSSSEQVGEKSAWLRQYHGAALIAEGLLKREDAEAELATLVPHLNAPGGGRKEADGKTPNVPVKPASEPTDHATK